MSANKTGAKHMNMNMNMNVNANMNMNANMNANINANMNIKKTILKCCIKTLSPMHIGCDEVYEPSGFVIDELNRQMTVFNFVDFIESLNETDSYRFNDICAKGTVESILELYKFLRNRSVAGRKIDVCKGFIDNYTKTLSINIRNADKIQKELNNFIISRTAFLQSDQRPYLPGSSIKGALRTAYLNLLEKKKKLANQNKFQKGQQLEQALMNYTGIHDDPFRLVKVSDFMPVGNVRTKIVYGVNVKKKKTDKSPRGIPSFFEIIKPGSIFQGSITVETPMQGDGIQLAINADTLLKSASEFYVSENKRENLELQAVGISSASYNDPETVLLRCGRHSGAEAVTIKGHRSIKIMGGKGEKPKYKSRTTTFWLASESKKTVNTKNLVPFGWAGINIVTDNLEKTLTDMELEYKKKIKTEKQIIHAKIENLKIEKQKRAEAKAKQLMEAEEKRKAKEERKKQLKCMTPEQRFAAELEDPDITENRVVEIFNKLDEFQHEQQKIIALALQKYWTSKNKWKKRNCSKKQWKKIQKIKGILKL